MKKLLFAAAFALLALVACKPADATEYVTSANAVGPCEVALPNYESQVRQRPTAIVNESDATVFVNCSFEADNEAGRTFFAATLHNYSGPNKLVRCTGVFGVDDGYTVYEAKNVMLAPGARSTVTWQVPQELSKTNTSLQCTLPPGVGFNELNQGHGA